MKNKAFLFVSILLGIFLFPIFTNANSVKDVEDMMKELESLKVEIGKVETAKTELKEEEKRLIATKELLKGAMKNLQKEFSKLEDERLEYTTAVDNHNARCASDRNYNCNSQAASFRAWKSRCLDKRKTLRKKRSMIDERLKGLSQATLEWSKKKKANNATLNDLYVKQEQLIQKIKSRMASPFFLMELKIRSDVSQECKEMKSLEDAHRCLQKVWDGAK